MITTVSLWLPIVAATVAVFIVSAVIHMVLTYHRSDFGKLPAEQEIMDALRRFDVPPGDYMMPSCEGPREMKSPEFTDRMNRGPVALMTFIAPGPPRMGANLVQWFVYCLLVSVFAAYVAGHALGPGAAGMEVFRFTGAVAFAGYALGCLPDSIWYQRQWSTTLKNVFDGLVYAVVTGGTFQWLWPAG